MKQITVKPGDGVLIDSHESKDEAETLLKKVCTPVMTKGNRGDGSIGLFSQLGIAARADDTLDDFEKFALIGTYMRWPSSKDSREITLDQLRHATNVVTPEQQALINDRFTLWFGDKAPVEEGVVIDAAWGDGHIDYAMEVVNPKAAHAWDHGRLIAYRLHSQQEPRVHGGTKGLKRDSQKPRPQLVMRDMAGALEQVIKLAEFGAKKYSDGNWLHVDDAHNRYTDAMLRHYLAEQQGELIDGETGIEHDVAVAWNALARLQIRINNQGQQ